MSDIQTETAKQVKKQENQLGMVAYACNPNTLGGQGQELETSLANMAKPVSTRNTKMTIYSLFE